MRGAAILGFYLSQRRNTFGLNDDGDSNVNGDLKLDDDATRRPASQIQFRKR